MKGSLIAIMFFAAGCLLGRYLSVREITIDGNAGRYALYLLMFQVGLSIGSDKNILQILKSVRPAYILVPLATIAGTLLFSALAAFFISNRSLSDCLAIGSGFAYYSLSSILITELKTVSSGAQAAAELGTIALMTNIIREIMALLGAPILVKLFGRFAPICAGGATTMDTTLPVITKYSGKDLAFIAILHGILIDLSVPFFVSFFCSL